MRVLKPAVTYFALVFGAGFILGTIRTLFVVPLVGTRIAELIEMPLMLTAIVFAAKWINQRFAYLAKPLTQLSFGLIALGLLLMGEVAVGVGLRGLSLSESLINSDPVSGTLYYVMLGVFVLMPWLLTHREEVY